MSAVQEMALLAVPAIIHQIAVACYEDEDARRIAGKENLVDYADADPETQQFWRIIAATALKASGHMEVVSELQQFVNAVETGMIDSPAEETLANLMRRAKPALAKARGDQ